jgi:putative membrane protein insertion efficiency factor
MSIATKTINFYQKYISPLTGSNCRFYPTCSEYAKWVFDNQNILLATYKTTARILRCNQLFDGGIDYPKIKFKPKNIMYGKKIDIKYYIIPYKKDIYYLVKTLKD